MKQKHLLGEITKYPNLTMPTSQDFIRHVNLMPRGTAQAVAMLTKHSIVEKLENGAISIIDPVLERWSK